MKIEKHIKISLDEIKAVDLLADSVELSKQQIKQALNKGVVWLSRNKSTQRIRRADKILKAGDQIHLYYDESVLAQTTSDAILIADEKDYSIWYKPSGMLSQGSKWGDHCTINRWVEKHIEPQRSAFIVHRLDRAASGLIIIAHKKKIAAYFSELFQRRQVEKKYQAIVHGNITQGIKLDSSIDTKPAVSYVKPIDYNAGENQSLIEVEIETGRKHQIRRHLSEAGFPIVGDRLYGDELKPDERDLCLTSCYLSFVSPVDKELKAYNLAESLRQRFE